MKKSAGKKLNSWVIALCIGVAGVGYSAIFAEANPAVHWTAAGIKAIEQDSDGQGYVTMKSMWAALDKKTLMEVLKNHTDSKKIEDMREKHEIILLKEGVDVTVQERPGTGLIKIRPVGHDFSLWTLEQVIGKKGK